MFEDLFTTQPKKKTNFSNIFAKKNDKEFKLKPRVFKLNKSLGGGSFYVGEGKTERDVSQSLKEEIRGGSFQETSLEVDHIFPIALEGTNEPENLEGKKSPLSFMQKIGNLFGKEYGAGERPSEQRQAGKTKEELKIINDYEAGKIGIWEAREKIAKVQREVTGLDEKDPEKITLWDLYKSGFEDVAKWGKAFLTKSADKTREEQKKAIENVDIKDKRNELLQYYGSQRKVVSPFLGAGTIKSDYTREDIAKMSDEQIEKLYGSVYKSEYDARQETAMELVTATIPTASKLPGEVVKRVGNIKKIGDVGEEVIDLRGAGKVEPRAPKAGQVIKAGEEAPKKELDLTAFKKKTAEIQKVEKISEKAKSEKLGDAVLQVNENKTVIKLPKNLTDKQRAKIYDEVATVKDFKKQPIHISQSRILDTPGGKDLEVITLNKAVKEYPEVKKLVDDIGLEVVGGRVQQPRIYKPITDTDLPQIKTGDKTAGLAKSIEAKAIEKGLIDDGFNSLASFEGTSMKEQAKAVKMMISESLDQTRAIVRGERALPEGVNGISVIKGMEEVVKKTKDVDLAYELANSPLVQKVSEAAQELSLTRGRTPDSATAQIQRIKKAREAKAGKAIEKRKSIKDSIKQETKKVNLSKEDLSWDKFLSEIKC